MERIRLSKSENDLTGIVMSTGLTVQEVLNSISKRDSSVASPTPLTSQPHPLVHPSTVPSSITSQPLLLASTSSKPPSPPANSLEKRLASHVSQLTSAIVDTPISFLPPALSLVPQQEIYDPVPSQTSLSTHH